MNLRSILEEMFEKDIYGLTEFEKIIKHSKGIEKLRARHDYKMVGKFVNYDADGNPHLKDGVIVPILVCLRSSEVMRDIISFGMI